MKLGILFSGGKDSTYAAYVAKNQGNELACLISLFSDNKDSYMFHTPSITKVKKQAEVMNLPLLIQKTKGVKEDELKDLEKVLKEAIKKYKIQGVISGAIASKYQYERIDKICNKLGIESFTPLWQKDEEQYWEDLFKNNFEIMITGVASEGLGKEWLGEIINEKNFKKLKELKKKFRFHIAFEGGEAETFVTNCPLFNKKIKVTKGNKIWDGNSGRYNIQKIELIKK